MPAPKPTLRVSLEQARRVFVKAQEAQIVPAVRGCMYLVPRRDAAAGDLSHFLADDIGHGRSFTLDTDEELRKRSGQIRGM